MIYIFHYQKLMEEQKTALVDAAKEIGEDLAVFTEADMGRHVEDAIRSARPLKDAELASVTGEGPTFLILDMKSSKVDQALAAFKARSLYLPYKCVLTRSNRKWTLATLMNNVIKEHAIMQMQMAARMKKK
jgi:hypothetical protein